MQGTTIQNPKCKNNYSIYVTLLTDQRQDFVNMEMRSSYCPMISQFHKLGKRCASYIILTSGRQFVIQHADIFNILLTVHLNVFIY